MTIYRTAAKIFSVFDTKDNNCTLSCLLRHGGRVFQRFILFASYRKVCLKFGIMIFGICNRRVLYILYSIVKASKHHVPDVLNE